MTVRCHRGQQGHSDTLALYQFGCGVRPGYSVARCQLCREKKKKKSSGRIRPPSRRLSRRTSPLPTVTCHQTSLVSPVGNVRTIGRRSKQRVETFSLPLPMYRGYDSACASFTGGDHGTGTHFSLWYHHGRHAFIRVEVDTWGNILHLSIFRKYGPPALVTAASFKRPCEAVSPLWRASLTIS